MKCRNQHHVTVLAISLKWANNETNITLNIEMGTIVYLLNMIGCLHLYIFCSKNNGHYAPWNLHIDIAHDQMI